MRSRPDVLLDTGPLVAVLDRSDQWHEATVKAWSELADCCVTTEAVVTEACHLVGRSGASSALPLEFLLAARIPVLGLETALHRHAVRLMRRYGDLPMDYADAALVALAGVLRITVVFTTDRKGFSAYRVRGRPLRMLPE